MVTDLLRNHDGFTVENIKWIFLVHCTLTRSACKLKFMSWFSVFKVAMRLYSYIYHINNKKQNKSFMAYQDQSNALLLKNKCKRKWTMKNSNLNDGFKFLIEMDVRGGKMFFFSTACCVETLWIIALNCFRTIRG